MGETANKTPPKRRGFQPGNPWRFKPGNKASPGRPPKDFSLTSVAKAMLEAKPELIEAMARKWLDQTVEGKTEARRDLQDRIEGRVPNPPQEVGGTIVLRVRYDD